MQKGHTQARMHMGRKSFLLQALAEKICWFIFVMFLCFFYHCVMVSSLALLYFSYKNTYCYSLIHDCVFSRILFFRIEILNSLVLLCVMCTSCLLLWTFGYTRLKPIAKMALLFLDKRWSPLHSSCTVALCIGAAVVSLKHCPSARSAALAAGKWCVCNWFLPCWLHVLPALLLSFWKVPWEVPSSSNSFLLSSDPQE